jgi:hypothetical protein
MHVYCIYYIHIPDQSTHKYTRLDECPNELFDAEQPTLKTEEEAVKCIDHVTIVYMRMTASEMCGETNVLV